MEKKQIDNKKVMIVSIISVFLLVFAIILTSYAVFTANLQGTKENKLNTGYVSLDCTETTFTLENTDVMTDAEGIAASGNTATCALKAHMEGQMKIGYDVALFDVDAIEPSDGLGTSNIKIQASKSINGGEVSYLAETSATQGVLVSSLENKAGQYDSTITNYVIDSANIDRGTMLDNTNEGTINYVIKAWVASEGNGGTTVTTNPNKCSDEQYTTQSACEGAGEVWGTSQKGEKKGGTFSFKLKVGATQVYND